MSDFKPLTEEEQEIVRQAADAINESIACRKCEKSCPQHLTIVDYLKEVASVFEK